MRGMVRMMKKTVMRGICLTLILMIAMFLIAVQVLQFMNLAEEILVSDEAGNVPQEQIDTISEANREMAASDTMQDLIIRQLSESPLLSGAIYAAMFILLAFSSFQSASAWKTSSGKTRTWILINAVLYLGCGIPFMIRGYTDEAVLIMNILYTIILAAESVTRLRKKHSPGQTTARVLLILLALVNTLILGSLPFFVLTVIILRSLKQILIISFAQIRLDVLRKIIRKTYASEILLGMILLIVSFSILLSMLDPGIGSFENALWFCFATVTTIGYGDVTAATGLGRILSVILGVYGIIVVALITSIIVNFYSETKTDSKDGQAETVEAVFAEEENPDE